MSYAVVHMQKFTRGGIRGIQSHNQREKPPKTNPDIDLSRSWENYDLVNPRNVNYNREITSRIEQFRKGQRAVRKDAVVLCNFIITSDQDFFRNLSSEKTRKFFEEALGFFAYRYGAENIISAQVHMDETTPHMHLGLVPITADGRLSAKSLFTPRELQRLQTDFALHVGTPWGLERGQEGSTHKHLSEQQFKAQKAQENAEQIMENARNAVKKAQKTLEDTKMLVEHKEALKRQIEGLEGVLDSMSKIEALGEKTGILGKKVVMSQEDAEKLKEQAKAYLAEKSMRLELERRVARLEESSGQIVKLQNKIIDLTDSNRVKENLIKSIEKVLNSDSDLRKAYITQARELDRVVDQRDRLQLPDLER